MFAVNAPLSCCWLAGPSELLHDILVCIIPLLYTWDDIGSMVPQRTCYRHVLLPKHKTAASDCHTCEIVPDLQLKQPMQQFACITTGSVVRQWGTVSEAGLHARRPHRGLALLDQENIPFLPWPAYSPDMSLIEHIWDMLNHRFRYRDPAPGHVHQVY